MHGSRLSLIILGIFLVLVVGVGFAIGLTIRPGMWYQSLNKPFFTPPNWIFAPTWTVVYVLIAIAGWRAAADGFRSSAFRLWLIQLALNWSWTPIFFGGHFILPGLAIIISLLAAAVLFMVRTTDIIARWCFAPYVAWLSYASTLNAAILVLN